MKVSHMCSENEGSTVLGIIRCQNDTAIIFTTKCGFIKELLRTILSAWYTVEPPLKRHPWIKDKVSI